MNNVGMANMNPMGGPGGAAPMPMMNNGAINPQAAAAASAHMQQMNNDSQRSILNTYIYEYFVRLEMYDCARALLSSDSQVNVAKDDAGGRRGGDNGNLMNGVDDAMDTDIKKDIDSKLPDDLPPPKLPMPASDTSFLYEWFCLFWDIYNAQRVKNGNNTVNQYVQHTQQQNRLKQNHQQELLRHARNDMNMNPQYQIIRNMQNSPMTMGMKQGNLARAAMANNQNPQMQMLQQAKQNQMQRDLSNMDANRDRPSSPASGDNAPSPSKRPRLDGAPFNANHPGNMMMNGRPGQGMPGQQMPMPGNVAAAQHMLTTSGINPSSLNPQQMQNFANAPPAAQIKSIATYSQNLQHHHGNQMGGKPMPNASHPQGQGSPILQQGSDINAYNGFYNAGEMTGPETGRIGPDSAQAAGGGCNSALKDYQQQLMMLESQNKKRLFLARQEQSGLGVFTRDGPSGEPNGHNQQSFPDASPQAMRTGTSPNPAEQIKRGTPQMNNSGIPSPVPEGGQSRDSPNPAMNFIANQVDPNTAPHFFKGMDPNMANQAQMNGMRPPSSHPGQSFNGPMNQQQMMARQQQQQQANPGMPQQWQQGLHNQMLLQQGMPQNQQVQGPPQRAMPPPSAPAAAAANNANNRTTASPQQAAAAPPTPSQSNKAAPKTKKDTKSAKDKRAATQKKMNQNMNNAGATPAGDNGGEPEAPAPATPITPVNPGGFNKNGQNGATVSNGQPSTAAPTTTVSAPAPTGAPAPQSAPVHQAGHGDVQNGSISLDGFGGMDFGSMEFANPSSSTDVLNDFDFDSFLHDNDPTNEAFDFNGTFPGMEGGEIGAD